MLENMGSGIENRSCLVRWRCHLFNASTVITVGTSSALQLLATVLKFDFLLSSLHSNSIFFINGKLEQAAWQLNCFPMMMHRNS
jgi:hypothetical protein